MGGEDPGLLDPFFAPGRDRVRRVAGVRARRLAGGAREAPRAARARGRRRAGDRVILGLDTSTAATAAAVWAPGGPAFEARHDPGRGRAPRGTPAACSRSSRPRSTARARAGTTSSGSPSGSARAASPACATGSRPPARSRRAAGCRWPASRASRRSPAAPAQHAGDRPVLAVIDARRGEVFAAAWQGGERLLEPVAIDPAELAASLGAGRLAGPLAAGDGAVRFREQLERAGALVPDDRSPAHRVSALQVCRLGAAGEGTDRDRLVPDYRREPDAAPKTAARDRSPHRRHRGPPPHLRGPAAGRRDRAPRLHDAVVAGDVRARALQAERRLPRGRGRRRARRLPRLLALRPRLAHHERLRGPRPAPPRDRHGDAARAVRAGRATPRRSSRSRCAAPTAAPTRSTRGSASRAPGSAAATTPTTARTRS